ncbi:conserved hypothetical protein [uncultured Desulfobacterium sp.]|uniref:t-SNARE coiled-coil homology domain-containing protein n=1 Tax=uncultured Desulfobacterium sp. TaxID=201089 RepID=A0A445MXA2_9BACT|nr:conserved hypothetical protein [uncultured Desulfobacterium sp.]
MSEEKKDEGLQEEGLTLDKKTIEVLVAHIIPTSKYFEARFDHMQYQIDSINSNLKEFRNDVDRRFQELRGEMDDRFKQVDRRFEQVDKRFEQMIVSIDRLSEKLDQRDERQRNFTLRLFTIAISISIIGVLGAFLKALGII